MILNEKNINKRSEYLIKKGIITTSIISNHSYGHFSSIGTKDIHIFFSLKKQILLDRVYKLIEPRRSILKIEEKTYTNMLSF